MVATLTVLLAPVGFIAAVCYRPGVTPPAPTDAVRRATADIPGYVREGSATYLTVPEWYIVYSTEEYASFLDTHPPSRFPYFAAVAQYWRYYAGICRATRDRHPFDVNNHLMLGVIGVSFSAETAVRGGYERTIGRLTEWAGGHATDEDAFARRTAHEYGAFMHNVPWYEFPFAKKLGTLWTGTPVVGPAMVRKWERKLALSGEYALKAGYAWLIRKASGAAYGAEALTIHARVEGAPEEIFADRRVRRVKALGPREYIVTLPRYEAFTRVALVLTRRGVRVLDIAGNDAIALTALAPRAMRDVPAPATIVLREPILTDPDTSRVVVRVPVASMAPVIAGLERAHAHIEHVYDY